MAQRKHTNVGHSIQEIQQYIVIDNITINKTLLNIYYYKYFLLLPTHCNISIVRKCLQLAQTAINYDRQQKSTTNSGCLIIPKKALTYFSCH